MKTRHFPRAGYLVLTALLALSLLGGCRAFEPEAVVVNQAPETYIIGSPTEHGGGYYHFHVYWYGSDRDGSVERFVWALTDTSLQDPDTVEDEEDENFNPALDASQLQIGHWTTKTDSIFDFKINQGVGTSYNMTLHMVAQDDFGDFDRTPARLHFFANSLGNPTIQFYRIRDVLDQGVIRRDTARVALGQVDTVGYNRPYEIFWTGSTPNIRGYDLTALAKIDTVYPYDDGLFGYKWRLGGSLDDGCIDASADCWHPRLYNEAASDSFSYFGDVTRLIFRNDDSGTSPFRRLLEPEAVVVRVNSIDVAGVEVAEFLRECSFVVNFDPDTRILDNEMDFAHPEDPETYPYYVLLNDPLQERHPFGSGDRIPDRSYVVVKALGRDHALDRIADEDFQMGFTGYVSGLIEKNYTGGRFKYTSTNSPLNVEPAWGESEDGWYADTLGFLVSPRTKMTVYMQAGDEHGRRDGSPDSLSFDVGLEPCVQCIEPRPFGVASVYDETVECYDPATSVDHPCFGGEAVFYVPDPTALQSPDRTYLPKMQFEVAFLTIDKVTMFASIETAISPAEAEALKATHYVFQCSAYGMDVLFHGQDAEEERYVDPDQTRWRTMAWKMQIDYDCDPENTIIDGAGADNIEVENWGVPSTGDGLTISSTGLWKKLVRFYVPDDMFFRSPAAFRTWVWMSQVSLDGYALEDPRVDEVVAICTRQFGRGRIQAVALDQTQCGKLPAGRPGSYHLFTGLRPPLSTLADGLTWRSCLPIASLSGMIDGSIPLTSMAMPSNNDVPVEKFFRVVYQAFGNEDVECTGDGF